ncbi:hypothetical protein [Massilia glaciei]|uniref:COG3904 family protein n=1 Tax=Massilia glaciei TaxID=1524097 RepID=UPI0011B257D3|nr:hypothetical protein [Massilia glaciei]
MDTMKNILLALAFFTTSMSVGAATVKLLPESKGVSMVFFAGSIEPGDASKVQEEFSKAPPANARVILLFSPGGSVKEAMRIGDYLELEEISASILPNMTCSSSCVLVLAGADEKTIKGRVGIHRPFVTDLSLGGEAGAATLGRVVEQVKTYLDMKGIAPGLAEDMFSVEPHKIRYLEAEELTRYRLDQTNYLKQERRDIESAKELGVTRQEFIARKARMNAECTEILDYDVKLACVRRTMYK